eukprot:TRINITY_DN4067_c0_g1_i11.p1 TRINITY_DN4067_c0_g1~~TRINITY_DN4067_c0_g1_i11.p1  ORF type:complete len:944 (+),score=497.76 TRINITY_DN4067_c0_g1_i11:56-2833(+)
MKAALIFVLLVLCASVHVDAAKRSEELLKMRFGSKVSVKVGTFLPTFMTSPPTIPPALSTCAAAVSSASYMQCSMLANIITSTGNLMGIQSLTIGSGVVYGTVSLAPLFGAAAPSLSFTLNTASKGLVLVPSSPLTFTLANLLTTATSSTSTGNPSADAINTALGMNALTLSLSGLAVQWSPVGFHLSGSVNFAGYSSTFDLALVNAGGMVFAATIHIPGAFFNNLMSALTGSTTDLFVAQSIDLSLSSAAFSYANYPILNAIPTVVQSLPQGLFANVIGGFNPATTNAFGKMLAGWMPAPFNLTLLLNPTTLQLAILLPTFVLGPTTTMSGTSFSLSITRGGGSAGANLAFSTTVNCMIGNQPAQFIGSLTASLTSASLTMQLSMPTTLTNAFGWSALTLSAMSGSATLSAAAPYLTGFMSQGIITLGSGTNAFTAAFALSINTLQPTQNYFYCSFNQLTVGQIVAAMQGAPAAAALPAFLASTGFPSGATFSFSGVPQTLVSGVALPAGFNFAGTLVLFGYPIQLQIAITLPTYTVNAVFGPINVGQFSFVQSPTVTNQGPLLNLQGSVGPAGANFSMIMSGYITFPEFAASAQIFIDNTHFNLTANANLLGLGVTANIVATAAYTGTPSLSTLQFNFVANVSTQAIWTTLTSAITGFISSVNSAVASVQSSLTTAASTACTLASGCGTACSNVVLLEEEMTIGSEAAAGALPSFTYTPNKHESKLLAYRAQRLGTVLLETDEELEARSVLENEATTETTSEVAWGLSSIVSAVTQTVNTVVATANADIQSSCSTVQAVCNAGCTAASDVVAVADSAVAWSQSSFAAAQPIINEVLTWLQNPATNMPFQMYVTGALGGTQKSFTVLMTVTTPDGNTSNLTFSYAVGTTLQALAASAWQYLKNLLLSRYPALAMLPGFSQPGSV